MTDPYKLQIKFKQSLDDIKGKPPREDYYKSVLLLNRMGWIKSPLSIEELANTLEFLVDDSKEKYKKVIKETGPLEFKVKMIGTEEVSKEDGDPKA